MPTTIDALCTRRQRGRSDISTAPTPLPTSLEYSTHPFRPARGHHRPSSPSDSPTPDIRRRAKALGPDAQMTHPTPTPMRKSWDPTPTPSPDHPTPFKNRAYGRKRREGERGKRKGRRGRGRKGKKRCLCHSYRRRSEILDPTPSAKVLGSRRRLRDPTPTPC